MNRVEQRLQTKIVNALRKRFDCFVAHVPNGGVRTRLEALAFKDAGVTAGVADLFITGPGGLIIFMEIKAQVKACDRRVQPLRRLETLDPNQKVFAEKQRGYGHAVAVVDNVLDAELVCEAAGFPPRPAPPRRSEAAMSTGF